LANHICGLAETWFGAEAAQPSPPPASDSRQSPLLSLVVATAVLEALLLLAYQLALGFWRDICRAFVWSVVAALAGLHLCVLGLEDFLQTFWWVCGTLIYLQFLFQFLTLAAYGLLICHFIWKNLA
jgi:hypothetical protein